MAQRIVRPGSAPSHTRTLGPPSDPSGKVADAGKSVLSILKDTNWPKEASKDIQDLIQTVETRLVLDKLPKEGTEIPRELRVAFGQLLGTLESVQTRLKGESDKYGTKKKGLTKRVTKFFSRNDPNECTEVVRNCQEDVVESSTTLKDLLNNLEAANELRSSPIAAGAARDDFGEPPSSHKTLTASALNPNVNAQSDLAKPSVLSNNPPDQSSTQVDQITSSKDNKQKGSSVRGGLLNSANIAFKIAEGASGALPVVGSYVGAVAKVGLTVVEMVQTMDDNDETAESLGNHVCCLSDVLERVRKHSQGSEKTLTINGINELQRELRSVQDQIEKLKAQRGMKKIWSSNDNAGSLKTLQEQVRAALEEIQLLTNLNVSILVSELHNESAQIEQRRLFDRLGDGRYGAQGNLIEDITCLPGTRVEILQRIDDWIRNASSSERVLWVRGMAGIGKSTIASTVAHNWKRRAACAIFHFRRGQNNLDNRLVCSLARQLGKSVDPELRNAILSSVREHEDVADQRLDEQFNALFVTPLSTARANSFPVLIIVDAVDECNSAKYVVDFIKLIKLKSPSLPDNIKFLITSRPEDSLLRAFESMGWRVESLDSGIEVDADIERFLHHGFAQIREDCRMKEEWPSPTTVIELVQMSQGLFQWARTVIKYISERSPTNRLTKILKAPEMWIGVDELYTQILSKALEKVNASPPNRDLLLNVPGTIITTPYPVSLEIIAFFHVDDAAVEGSSAQEVLSLLREEILADLTSLLLIPESATEPIRLMHTSIRDLLLDFERCKRQPYWVDLAQHHRRLASVCILQMNRHLRENICNLEDLSKPCSEVQDMVEREVSNSVQYCCRSWSIHLTKGDQASQPTADNQLPQAPSFKLFCEEKVLFWLEVMSLIGSSNEAIMMAKQVHQWLSHFGEASGSSSLITLWNDVHRFATAFSEPIAFSPLHIYTSALAHCPKETELWRRYSGNAKVVTIRGVQPSNWSSEVWSRSVGTGVESTVFSPDSTLLASGFEDHTVRLLDAHTGRQMGEPLTGHSGSIKSVCFSPDGKLLASGSHDCTILLWNPQTGRQVGEPLTGHLDCVMSVCFSPDSQLLASGSDDCMIRLWDPQTRRQVGGPLTGHSRPVCSVCFSPDGKLLASGSRDKTLRLWDPQTGRQVGEPLIGECCNLWSVCFSPDSKLLAYGSDDCTIRLLDAHTGRQMGEPLTGHRSTVMSICFSPDGKLLASGSFDRTIRLWDLQTNRQIDEPLTGHGDPVMSVCFSADSKLLASGSVDNTVRLWDSQISRKVDEPLEGQSGTIWTVHFSPDGKLLASGSIDHTICLWDLQTGRQVGELLTGHSNPVTSVCFSPDGKLLASASRDQTIRLWDPQTCSQVGEPLSGHSGQVLSVRFSPDGKVLASASEDHTVRLWDPQTGRLVGKPLTGHSNCVTSICFSPDGGLLASASKDQTVRLWDPQTGKQVGGPLTGHSRAPYYVYFSLDGAFITGHDILGGSIAWDVLTLQVCDAPSCLPRLATLDYEDHWVTVSSSRLFWLPSQFWGDGWYSRNILNLCEGKLAVTHYEILSIFDLSDALSMYNH